MTKRKDEPAKPGTKPLPEGARLKSRSYRFTDEMDAHIKRQGGADYLRRLVDADRKKGGGSHGTT